MTPDERKRFEALRIKPDSVFLMRLRCDEEGHRWEDVDVDQTVIARQCWWCGRLELAQLHSISLRGGPLG
jgi:hypothetical protein